MKRSRRIGSGALPITVVIAVIATTSGCTDASNVMCILIGKVNEHGPGGEENSLRAV
ncbi:MAG: hypothetical protein RI963_3768 [Planctomycetota bacterium]